MKRETTLLSRNDSGLCSLSKRSSRRVFCQAVVAAILVSSLLLPASGVRAAESLHILAATYPAYLATLTAVQGIESVECELLVAASRGCPHDYAMSPQDRMKLEKAQVLVLNGAGFEPFLDERLLSSLKALKIEAGKGLPDLACPEPLAADHHGHKHGEAGGNPHYFSSPVRFGHMVSTIALSLGEEFPALRDRLQANALSFAKKVQALEKEMQALSGSGVQVILQHDTLSWFFHDMHLPVAAVLQQGSEEGPSPALLLALAGRIKKEGKPCLLVSEPQFAGKSLNVLAQETGAARVALDPVVSGPVTFAGTAGDYYLGVMQANIKAVAQALKK